MKRVIVFTVLFPLFTLIVYITADRMLSDGLPGLGMITGLVAIAYVLAIIPAFMTAGVDWSLSNRPLVFRLIVTMPMAAIMAELVAHYMGQPRFDLSVALAGAIPAAVCSWVSDKLTRNALT